MSSPRTVRLRLRYADPTRSEWCGGCGRRRSPDGRCPRCDAWWASPLVSVGFPLIFAIAVLLAVGIRALRDNERLAARPRAEVRALAFPAFTPAPVFSQPERVAAADLPPVRFAEEPQQLERPVTRPRPRRITMADQVRLRELSDHAHAVIVADDAVRARAKEDARQGRSSVEVHAAPFTPPTQSKNGAPTGGSLPLPSQTRAPGTDASTSGFFDMFAPGSAPRVPAGNYAPGVPVPAASEVR